MQCCSTGGVCLSWGCLYCDMLGFFYNKLEDYPWLWVFAKQSSTKAVLSLSGPVASQLLVKAPNQNCKKPGDAA